MQPKGPAPPSLPPSASFQPRLPARLGISRVGLLPGSGPFPGAGAGREGEREEGREGRREEKRGGGREDPAPGDDGAQRCVQRGAGLGHGLGKGHNSGRERDAGGLEELSGEGLEVWAGLLSLEAAQRSWLGLRNLGANPAFPERS